MGTVQRACLVTGGAGFIGSHLVEHLLRRGDRVVVIDDLSTGRRSNLEQAARDRLSLIETKVSDGLSRFQPGDFDAIYHLAAAVGVRLVIEEPIHTIVTNVVETAAVLDFATAASTPVLLASTSEVYGKSTKTPFAEDDDVVYGPTAFSRWSYACSKAIDEYLGLAHHRKSGLPVAIIRFFNTVGPRQVGTWGMVLPRFIAAALGGDPLEVYGDGRQTRCFCDVRDIVNVLPDVLGKPECAGRVMNLGSDQPIEIGALAELVRDTLDSKSPIVNVPYSQAFGEGFDDLADRRPDLTRIREVIGFEPHTPLVQTIRDMAAEIRQQAPSLESTV
ncbi:MAG: GDP-mannose 4,6-dehydratase [Planctomycetota bacterium]|jgi:UDP-glucose 4-epimerase